MFFPIDFCLFFVTAWQVYHLSDREKNLQVKTLVCYNLLTSNLQDTWMICPVNPEKLAGRFSKITGYPCHFIF